MSITRHWKVTGASAVVGGLALGGLLGAASADPSDGTARTIDLRDVQAMTDLPAPEPVGAPVAVDLSSPDGESFDSPLQSVDDSVEGADSVDTPDAASPDGESFDSPLQSVDDSPDGADSLDSVDVAAVAPTPTDVDPVSVDSPDPVSVDSPDPVSVDSPDPVSVDSPDPVSVDSPDAGMDSPDGSADDS